MANSTANNSTNSTTNTSVVVSDNPALKKEFKLVNQWQSCWNVELDDDTLFCYGAVPFILHQLTFIDFRFNGPLHKKSSITLHTMTHVSSYEILTHKFIVAKAEYAALLAKWRMT